MKLITFFFSSLLETIQKERSLFLLFLFTILSVFFYSFTQVDLSLTLSRASFVTDLQRAFQHIGYFNRLFSTLLFIGMIVLLITTYILLLRKVITKQISRASVWVLLLMMSLILSFSYNAFSHDIFNYMFDAKIVTHYHENPYERKALDYPADPMLSFMHWTHRTYPYGPVWLAGTIPFSFIGMNYFLLTFFLFKLGIAASFVGTVYFIEKIMQKVSPDRALLTTTLVAFHPLLIIENLVSGHNDIVMMFFVFLAIYFLVRKQHVLSILSWVLSVGVKFATVFLLPSFAYVLYARNKRNIDVWDYFFLLSGCLMLFSVLVASKQSNFQPWYLTWALPFFLMLPRAAFFRASEVVNAGALFSLIAYIPFLFTGDWNTKIPTTFFLVLWGSITLVYIGVFMRTYFKASTS